MPAAPVPFLTSAVVATSLLLEAGSELLPTLAARERTAALAVPLSTASDAALPAVSVDAHGRLIGTVTSVAGAIEAEVRLVPADIPDGLAVYAVSAAVAGVAPVISLDMTRQLADVTLDGVSGEPVRTDAEPAVCRALDAGAALLAAEQLGVARWCLDATVGYLKERRQFGRVVGGFQTLKHRLADVYTGVESAAAAARYAAPALAAGDTNEPVATAIAQAYCSDLAVLACEEAVQLHGASA